MAIEAANRELLGETARRIQAHGYVFERCQEAIEVATSDADMSAEQASAVASVGRHVWPPEEWLEMGLHRLIART